MRLGEIVRADLGFGLQSQTYNICRMLKPDKLLLIDSRSFNQNDQKYDLYENFNYQVSDGFVTNRDALTFIRDLTHIITAETFYNHFLVSQSNLRGIKTFNQYNWEFCEHIEKQHLPQPYKWLAPSYWKLEEMQNLFDNVVYLPPPIIMSDFKRSRDKNLSRDGKKRFLHVIGKAATKDRNGTLDVLDALRYTDRDFELVIRSQFKLEGYDLEDRRIRVEIGNIQDQGDLYSDFDAMILPRRYGGLCLPMNEALCSALPVIMTDISPNNQVLPSSWLIDSEICDVFRARTLIDVYRANTQDLAERINWFCSLSRDELNIQKANALAIGHENYSSDTLKEHYINELELND
jgi:hypothetical protein